MPTDADNVIVVPLAAEEIEISRRRIVTGNVTVRTVTTQSETEIDEILTNTRVEIERVPVRVFIDEVPAVRTEGDVTIIPVIEEIVVKRLFLKEEVRLRRVPQTVRHRETVVLREEEAVITRQPSGAGKD